MEMKIGFIGLGIMGKPMCKNLIKAGYEVVVSSSNQKTQEELTAAGAQAADSVKELSRRCQTIITMLPNGPEVESVVCGQGGVLEGAKEGTIIIDMSSIAPLASKRIAEKCTKAGVFMIDAPVSGGEPKAIDGTLAIMCGGPKEIFDRCKEVLSVMGTSVVHCGEGNGAGNTVKLANQMIVAVNIAACAEAFSLSTMAGVEPEKVFDAIRGGLAGSAVMNAKLPMMMDGNFDPGFRIDLHIKDLNNALDTGHGLGAPMYLTSQVQEMLQWLTNNGSGGCDHSGILKYYEMITGQEVRK